MLDYFTVDAVNSFKRPARGSKFLFNARNIQDMTVHIYTLHVTRDPSASLRVLMLTNRTDKTLILVPSTVTPS
jgi:hypothetical protein